MKEGLGSERRDPQLQFWGGVLFEASPEAALVMPRGDGPSDAPRVMIGPCRWRDINPRDLAAETPVRREGAPFRSLGSPPQLGRMLISSREEAEVFRLPADVSPERPSVGPPLVRLLSETKAQSCD